MQDLIISDEEFSDYAEDILYLNNALEGKLSSIINQLQYACDSGYKNGVFHDNLSNFISALSGLQGQLGFVTGKLQAFAEGFVEDIDEIDRELY